MGTFTSCRKVFFFALFSACLTDYISLYVCAAEPLIWHSPSPSEHFVGRESELKKIHLLLKKKHKAAFVGGSGWGKTETAKEYIRRYHKQYDIIWWFDARQSLPIQFLNLSKSIDPSSTNTPDSAAQYGKDYLRRAGKRFLLIFDDVHQFSEIEDFLPMGNGHILATSQNKQVCTATVTLSALSRKESIRLLEKVMGRTDVKGLDELGKILSDFPLSLVQSGSYLRSNLQSDALAYIDLFKTKRRKLMDMQSLFVSNNKGMSQDLDAKKPFFTAALRLTFDQIKKEDPLAFDILKMISFLYHHDLSPEMLTCSSQDIAQLSALATLEKYSILEKGKGSYRTHELTQTTMRDNMSEEEQRESVLKAVDTAKQAMLAHRNKITDTSVSESLLKNLMVAVKHADDLGIVQKEVIEAKIYILDYCYSTKKPSLIDKSLIDSIDKYLGEKNDVDPLLLAIYYPHMSVYYYYFHSDSIKRRKAIENIKKAIFLLDGDTRKIVSEDKATALYYLVQMYALRGELREAEKYLPDLQKAVNHCASHMKLYYNALALWIIIQNGNVESSDRFISELTKYEDQATSATSHAYFLYVQADALAREGLYAQARDCARQAYQISVKENGTWALSRAALVLAVCHLHDKELNLAKEKVEEAIGGMKTLFKGPDKVHEQAYAHIIYGDIFVAEENLPEAWAEYEKAEKIYENLLESMAIADVATLYEKMALTAARMDRQVVTKDYFNKLREVFGVKHLGVMRVLEYLNKKNLPLPLLDPRDF